MKLNRRSFLGLIGLAPAAVVAAKLPALTVPVAEPTYHDLVWKKGFSYDGDGATERFISHSYGHAPTFILIKKKEGWKTYGNVEAYLKEESK